MVPTGVNYLAAVLSGSPPLPAGSSHRRRGFARAFLAIAFVASADRLVPAAEPEARSHLGLPVDCKLRENCFVQQMPDIDVSDQVLDPLCGKATYQGHDGWDIRVRSLKELDPPTPVIAVAEGTVIRTRDGVPDRIFDRMQ